MGLTLGERDERIAVFVQPGDEQVEEIGKTFQKVASSLVQTRLIADRPGMVFLVIAQDAMIVAADDKRGVVKLAAGDVVSLEATHVIQPTHDAACASTPRRSCILCNRASRFNSLSSISVLLLNDAIDLLEGLAARIEAANDVWSCFKDVGPT